MRPLTNIETAVLLALQDETRRQGRPPSMDELAERAETSRASAQRAVNRLEALGFVQCEPKKWRSVRLIDRKGRNMNLDRLSEVLYGHKPAARDYLGGADARILADAADEIERCRARVAELDRERHKLREDLEFQSALTKEFMLYQDRALQAEQERNEARAKLKEVATYLAAHGIGGFRFVDKDSPGEEG